MSHVDPPDGLDDLDELTTFLEELAAAHNDLADEVERIDGNLNAMFTQTSGLQGHIDELDERLDDIDDHIELVDASMPDQQKGKLEKIRAILEYATSNAAHGPGGVVIDTGEASAAAGSSRDTARRLMDEIGSTFPWARVENPGGPNPKQLKIQLREKGMSDLLADVRAHYTDDSGVASG